MAFIDLNALKRALYQKISGAHFVTPTVPQNVSPAVKQRLQANQQQAIRQQQGLGGTVGSSFVQAVPKTLAATGLATGRLGVDAAQGLSGLYDLATPGKGTNRVSKALDKGAKAIDRTAQNMGVNPAYRIMQAAETPASFFVPGAAVSKLGKGGKVVTALSKTPGVINKGIQGLEKGNLAQRAIATGIREGVKPVNAINAAYGTGTDLGRQSGKGQQITPLNAGISAAANVVSPFAFPTAGHVAAELTGPLARVSAKGAQGAVKVAGKAGQGIAQSAKDFTGKIADNKAIDQSIKRLQNQKAMLQQRIANTPVNAYAGVENIQKHMDMFDSQIQELKASKHNILPKDQGGYIQIPGKGALKESYHPKLAPARDTFGRIETDKLDELAKSPDPETRAAVAAYRAAKSSTISGRARPTDMPGKDERVYDLPISNRLEPDKLQPDQIAYIKQQGFVGVQKGDKFVRFDTAPVDKVAAEEAKPGYAMSHRPSESGSGHDITDADAMPKDFYDHPEYYANMDEKTYQESLAAIRKMRGNPDAEVTIYRASPKGELNHGDWVTLSKAYAKQESQTENTPVHSFKVKAKDIQFAGDDINEFGYFPTSKPSLLQKANSAADIEKKYAGKADLSLFENDREITLSKIIVPKSERGKGTGTQVLKDITDYADKAGKRIVLTPSNDFGGSVSRLKEFYKRAGFVENKGRNKDFSTRELMYRDPKQSLIQTIKKNLPDLKNQSGYAKIPGVKDFHPDLSPKQKEFINEYANMLEDMGSGNGVDILPDGRRVSNNARDGALKGQTLTKQQWFDKARKDLESGKGAYGASDEYKTLTTPQKTQPPTVPPKAAVPESKQGTIDSSTDSVAQPDTSKLNTARLNTTDEGKAVLDEKTNEVIGKLSNKDIQAAAKAAGIDTKTHNIDQTKAIIAKQLNVRQNAVSFLKQAHATDDLELKADLIKKAAEAGRTSRTQGTDIARQLQARKIMANELDSPEQRIFKLLDEAGVNPDVYSKRLANVDFNNTKEVVNAYRDMVPAKFGNWLDTVRYNSMLSSPLTQAVNIFGNAQGVLVGGAEKTLRGAIDAAGGLFGKPRQYVAGEGPAYLSGSVKGIQQASHNFVNAMRGTGKYANPDLTDNIPLATKGVAGAAYNTLSFPMRVLDGFDKFFRTIAESGEESALKARAKGGIPIRGNRDLLKKAEADYRVFQTDLGTPGQGIVNQTFDDFAKGINHFRNHKNPIVSTIAKFTSPFVKTVNNISKQGIVDYSPLGIVNMKGNADKTTALTRAVMGSAVFGTSAALLAQGQMTWAEPRNANDKAQFRADGKQPYSVKVGNKWVGFSKLHPAVAFPMAMTAAIHDALDNKEINQNTADAVLSAIGKYGSFLGDQSYAKSVGDTLAALGGDKEAITKMIGNNTQQLVPFRALTGWLARMTDPLERKVDTSKGWVDQQVQALMQQYPGLREKTPTRDNAGIPIAANNQVFNSFSPVRVTNDRTNGNYNAGGVALSSGRGTSNSGSKPDDIVKAAFSTPEARKFLSMSDADKKAAAQSDPEARALYDQYQALKTGNRVSSTLRPQGLDPAAAHVLDNYDRMTTTARNKVFDRTPQAQYEYNYAKYLEDKAAGKLSETDDIKRQTSLAKDQVGANFKKVTRDLYGLTGDQLYGYATQNPNGNKLVSDVLAYGDALVQAGLATKNKFRDKYGNVTLGKTSGGSSSGRTPHISVGKPKTVKFSLKSPKSAKHKAFASMKVSSTPRKKIKLKAG